MASPKPQSSKKSGWLPWLGAVTVVGGLLLLWQPVSQISPDTAMLRAWIEQLGIFAPAVFFILNVLQIVVAPIPGYPVQVLGGILFGFIPGAIYTVGGMVAGGVLAAWLARKLGRPWLEGRVGQETLQRWNNVAHFDGFWIWWVILLIPLGDIPYFLAGLSRIKLRTLALAILTSRGPFTVLIVWLGDSVVNLPLTYIVLFTAVVTLVVIVGFRLAGRIEAWGYSFLTRRLNSSTDEPFPPDNTLE